MNQGLIEGGAPLVRTWLAYIARLRATSLGKGMQCGGCRIMVKVRMLMVASECPLMKSWI